MDTHRQLNETLQRDLENIGQIPIISSLLDVISQTTGMGFVAVARVTADTWLACRVRDDIAFGLQPGEELPIKTTICHEIRQHGQPVVIDDVATDPGFFDHHTPALYGFRSYISFPIIRRDGSFFGTLCAIDPRPNTVSSPAITGMFTLFADLLSFHLQTIEEVAATKQSLAEERLHHQQTTASHQVFSAELERQVRLRTQELHEKAEALKQSNDALQAFTFVASHDLQEPLRKIKFYASKVVASETKNLSSKGKEDLERIVGATTRMQTLLRDLITYPQTTMGDSSFETVDLVQLVAEIKADLAEEIEQKNAIIEVRGLTSIKGITFQLYQLFYHLLSNSLKFCKPGTQPRITVHGQIEKGKNLSDPKLKDDDFYSCIELSDNGIGFPPVYNEKIFQLFQRLHSRNTYDGTGIGLAIVKKVVDHHKGYIKAMGRPEGGATFTMYLPCF
jgi:signal transduction histidine kinase